MSGNPNAEIDETEVNRRRDAALLRALSTPHKRQKEMKIGKHSSVKTERGPEDPRRG
jgi:hypothetical protein